MTYQVVVLPVKCLFSSAVALCHDWFGAPCKDALCGLRHPQKRDLSEGSEGGGGGREAF